MFSLIPRRKAERELARTEETPLSLMRREFASLFDRFFGRWPEFLEIPDEEVTAWGFEVEDKGPEVVVRAELPGFELGDIEISIVENLLTIRAEHKAEEKKEEREERYLGRLERSVTLPPGVDLEKIEARYVNGVLEVQVPRKPEVLPRKIEVKG
jgi:HSP20 family protein